MVCTRGGGGEQERPELTGSRGTNRGVPATFDTLLVQREGMGKWGGSGSWGCDREGDIISQPHIAVYA